MKPMYSVFVVKQGRVLALFAAAACACSVGPDGPRATHAAEIHEAVFRAELQQQAIEERSGIAVAFFEVYGRDPPRGFVDRFRDTSTTVLPASAATLVRNRWFDKDTAKYGWVLRVDSMRWIGNDAVEVTGSRWISPIYWDGVTYYVTWRDGGWMVDSMTLEWSS